MNEQVFQARLEALITRRTAIETVNTHGLNCGIDVQIDPRDLTDIAREMEALAKEAVEPDENAVDVKAVIMARDHWKGEFEAERENWRKANFQCRKHEEAKLFYQSRLRQLDGRIVDECKHADELAKLLDEAISSTTQDGKRYRRMRAALRRHSERRSQAKAHGG